MAEVQHIALQANLFRIKKRGCTRGPDGDQPTAAMQAPNPGNATVSATRSSRMEAAAGKPGSNRSPTAFDLQGRRSRIGNRANRCGKTLRTSHLTGACDDLPVVFEVRAERNEVESG